MFHKIVIADGYLRGCTAECAVGMLCELNENEKNHTRTQSRSVCLNTIDGVNRQLLGLRLQVCVTYKIFILQVYVTRSISGLF